MVNDRLTLQQMRIDDIIVNDMNFVRLLKSMEPNLNTDNELQNDYNSILNNQKTRNLLALKLSLTYSVIECRQDLGNDMDNLIQLIKIELKSKQ